MTVSVACPICGQPTSPRALKDCRWASAEVLDRLARQHPHWQREDGACPACIQTSLVADLVGTGDGILHDGIQRT